MTKRRSPGEGSISKRPDGRWMAQVVVGGHTAAGNPKRRTVYATTKTELLRRLQQAQHEAGMGPVDRRATLRQVVDAFLLARKARLRASTYDSYERVLLKHGGALLRLPVARITTTTLEHHLAALREKLPGGALVQYHRRVLRMVFRFAVARKFIVASPAAGLESVKHERDIPEPWEPAEAAAFLDAALGARLYPLFHLALATGMRVGELLGLQWADVALESATLTVRRSRSRSPGGLVLAEPKSTRSRRTIALDPETVAVLAARQEQRAEERATATAYGLWEGGDYVFCSALGRPISPSWVRAELDRIAKAAGVRHIRVHDLRHTAATLALRAGVPVQVLSERLGHTRTSLTMDLYVSVLQEQRVAAALSLDQLLKRDAVAVQYSKATN